jgi:hypothetical protein
MALQSLFENKNQPSMYGNSATWNMFNPGSVYNPMQKQSPIDTVSQTGGVSKWIQNDLGINANTMSDEDLFGLNDKYQRATTDLGGNWERQRVVDKNTGADVASNDYYHEPFNIMKDVVMPAALVWGGGYGLSNLFAGAGAGASAGLGSGAATEGAGSLYSLGGEVAGSGLIPGTGTTGLQASLGSGLTLAAPTASGTGLSIPGISAATSGGGAMDIIKSLGKSLIGGQGGGISNLGNLASLFSNYKQYSNTGDLMDDIKGIYSPDGVYAKELEKQLARRDAAAGRNSQYGPRLAELMARLGDSQARSLSGLGGMMQTQQGGLNGMLGAGQRVLEGTGILDKLFSIFGD